MVLTVKEIKEEAGNAFSIIFENSGDRFYPGQYLEFEGKCFSIASSPSEDFLMITTKPSSSSLKRKFLKLKPGETLESSHPAGTVTIDEIDPLVFLAGGIGITPFRSMIKWAVDSGFKTPMTLIYTNSNENFIFKKELDTWQKTLPNLTIHYINTSKKGHLNEAQVKQLVSSIYHLTPIYYLAGPPKMVDDFEKILLDMGIDSTSIRTDRYDGY